MQSVGEFAISQEWADPEAARVFGMTQRRVGCVRLEGPVRTPSARQGSQPRRARVRPLLVPALIALLSVVGCASDLLLLPPDEHGPWSGYQIGTGDVLGIEFLYAPELDEEVAVRPDGSITLQLVGDVAVRNRTPHDVASDLRERYEPHVTRSEIAVIVRDTRSRRASVGGEVRLPGIVRLDGETTLADALLESGGHLDTAELTKVVLVRFGEKGPAAYRVDLRAALRGEAEIPVLRRYDIVFVPKSSVAEVGKIVNLYINRIVPYQVMFVARYLIFL